MQPCLWCFEHAAGVEIWGSGHTICVEVFHVLHRRAGGPVHKHFVLQAVAIDEVVRQADPVGPHQVDVVVIADLLVIVIRHDLVGLHAVVGHAPSSLLNCSLHHCLIHSSFNLEFRAYAFPYGRCAMLTGHNHAKCGGENVPHTFSFQAHLDCQSLIVDL